MRSAILLCGLLAVTSFGFGQDWNQWRGPNRDNKATNFKAPATWPKELTRKWAVKVGDGNSSPVMLGDKVIAFGRIGGEEVVTCVEAESGKEVWRDKYTAPAVGGPAKNYSGPRAAPVAAEGKVCTFGVGGTLSCYDVTNGKVLWRKDTRGVPKWYTAAAPLIAEGSCIAISGGPNNGEVVAYDLTNGNAKWTHKGDAPSYGSLITMTVGETKMLVTPTDKSVLALNLADGKQLWSLPFVPGQMAYNNNTPIVDGDTLIYATQGIGTIAYKIEKTADGSFKPKELWKKRDTNAQYNTPMLKDGVLYGLSGGRGGTSLYAMDATTGEKLWTESGRRGEFGGVIDVGSVLVALTTDMELVVFKPSKKEFELVAKYKVADSAPWTLPILTGNRIYVQDKSSLILWTVE